MPKKQRYKIKYHWTAPFFPIIQKSGIAIVAETFASAVQILRRKYPDRNIFDIRRF